MSTSGPAPAKKKTKPLPATDSMSPDAWKYIGPHVQRTAQKAVASELATIETRLQQIARRAIASEFPDLAHGNYQNIQGMVQEEAKRVVDTAFTDLTTNFSEGEDFCLTVTKASHAIDRYERLLEVVDSQDRRIQALERALQEQRSQRE